MHFIHPFPASHLSSDELLRAISAWLATPSSPDKEGELSCDTDEFYCASISVPLVFSHDEWFVQCMPALAVLLDDLLLQQEEQQKNDEECHMRLLLRHMLALTTRIPIRSRHRDEMRLFIDIFGTLLRCSAQPECENTRRLAQKALVVLLNRFEPIAQFLLLARLFQLLTLRELPLSHQAYEPQLMAWLVDIYRTKCYAKDDDTEGTPTTTEAENWGGTEKGAEAVGELFKAQLDHFYAQIEAIVFEDPAVSVNFYVSVCLLLIGQSLHRHRPTLLRQIGPSWLNRVRDQLRDWRDMDEASKVVERQKGETQKRDDDDMASELRRQTARSEEQQQLYGLYMLAFQLEEAERRVEEALSTTMGERK